MVPFPLPLPNEESDGDSASILPLCRNLSLRRNGADIAAAVTSSIDVNITTGLDFILPPCDFLNLKRGPCRPTPMIDAARVPMTALRQHEAGPGARFEASRTGCVQAGNLVKIQTGPICIVGLATSFAVKIQTDEPMSLI